MKKTILILSAFAVASCNATAPKSADDNFVGIWKYYKSSYEHGEGDGTLQGLTATVRKIEGTNKNYIISYIKYDIPFEAVNDTMLKSTRGTFIAQYSPSTKHLTLYTITGDETNFNEFTRLE
jgi:hypothetical protein